MAVAFVARANGAMTQLCAAQAFDGAAWHEHEPLSQDGTCNRQTEHNAFIAEGSSWRWAL